VRVESKITVERLSALANKHLQSKEMLSYASLLPFFNFLMNRWYEIRYTDAIYPHVNDSLANRCCIELAKVIVDYYGGSLFQLLMPHVRFLPCFTSESFNNFVLTDDDVAIDVIKSLDDARKHKFHDFFYSEGIAQPKKQLSKLERDRVIHHSEQAYQYYFSFFLMYGERLEASQAIDSLRDRYVDSLLKNNCQLTASYNAQGTLKLVKSLVSMISTPHELAMFMTKYFDKFEWDQFIEQISNEDLFRIVLLEDYRSDIKTDTKTLLAKADKALYKLLSYKIDKIDTEPMARAFFFNLLAVYMRIRKSGPDYKSTLGHYVGSYLPWATGTYTKDQRLEVCEALKAFILSNEKMNELESYLKSQSQDHYWEQLKVKELGMLTQQMIRIALNFVEARPSQLRLAAGSS
jgi:hypothetical protein